MIQTSGKATSKPQDIVSSDTSSFAAAGPSSKIGVNDHPAEGQSLSDISEPEKSQQQNDVAFRPSSQASDISSSANYLPTSGSERAQKQSEANPIQRETSALDGQADAVANHGVTQVSSQVNEEETHSPDPGNRARPGQSQSDSSSAVVGVTQVSSQVNKEETHSPDPGNRAGPGQSQSDSSRAVVGVTQVSSHGNEEETHSPDPGDRARPGQIQSDSSRAVVSTNSEGSTSNGAAAQLYTATDPQPTAPEADGRLPSIIFLHDSHQEPSKENSAFTAHSVASPTSLASDPNGNKVAQVQDDSSIAQDVPGGGLAIGSQTLALGQQAEIQGVTVSVGHSVIALDGATYTRADIGGSTAHSGTAVAALDDEEPFTMLSPTQAFAGVASLTATSPGASISAPLGGLSAVVSGSQGSPTYTDASARNPDSTGGGAAIGAAIMKAFNPIGSLPTPVISAPAAEIGITSKGGTSAVSNDLTGVAPAQGTLASVAHGTESREGISGVSNGLTGVTPAQGTLASIAQNGTESKERISATSNDLTGVAPTQGTLASAAQNGTESRGSISAASNSLTGVARPSSPAPSPFDSAATMLTAVHYLKWLSISLVVSSLRI